MVYSQNPSAPPEEGEYALVADSESHQEYHMGDLPPQNYTAQPYPTAPTAPYGQSQGGGLPMYNAGVQPGVYSDYGAEFDDGVGSQKGYENLKDKKYGTYQEMPGEYHTVQREDYGYGSPTVSVQAPDDGHVVVVHYAYPFITESDTNRYIAKVLAIVAFQLTITTLMSIMFMLVKPIRDFAQTSIWLYLGMFIATFVFLFTLFCFKEKRPINYILMTLFTICISFSIALTATFYKVGSVLNVLAITAIVTIGIIGYVVFTKEDFSYSAGLIAYITLWTIFWYLLWTLLFCPLMLEPDYYHPGVYAYTFSCLGVILFTALLLFDISRVVQNNYDHGDGAVILGALNIYLDILNLFLCLLSIFGKRN